MQSTTQNRFIPGLDGLRAFAVLAVIAYHFNFSWAKGGFLGVDIFFVLSGYLITSILLPTQGNQLTLNLRKFWVGRIRRLLPASLVMIIATFVWVTLFHRELLDTVRGDAISSIFYASNWWFIFHKLSYFDSFGSPSPLKNLWSLSIEEQFYLIWPIVLAAGLFVFKKRSRVSIFVLICALCSALLMGMLYQPGTDPSRVYYGTDTRSFELLIGCCLALVWPMKRLTSKKLTTNHSLTLNITSMIAFSILILCIFFVDEYQVFLYRGGMLLICINTAILLACVCHPASFLGKMLSWKPLRWIGSRSYGIYLWHYPIIVLGTPVQDIGNPVLWRVILQLVITLIIAELSYRYIEMPIRKHGFRTFFSQHFTINFINWKKNTFVRGISTLLITLILFVFTAGITGVVKGEEKLDSMKSYPTQVKINHEEQSSSSKSSNKNSSEKKESITEKDSSEKKESIAEKNSSTQEESIAEKNSSAQEESIAEEIPPVQEEEKGVPPKNEKNNETSEQEKNDTSVQPDHQSYTGILALGDSILIDIASSLQKIFPNITIDAKVGRQVSQAVDLVPSYIDFNHPDKAVIIMLGTNGYFTNTQIDSLLGAFSNAHIYLVNTRVPRSWESKVNTEFYKKAQENDNITLVDWYSAAIGHPEYFAADGVHLQPKGINTLTNLINQAIMNTIR
ncbi:acyltransferase family protein [Cytobacillus dafuensis]|uniref:Acyltransferase family protein n=1 Tax=Cytobacillus dafuensis TaxID=1742359 RepID=A0A5B8Z1S6_CYTDA|nr:acyltransferase family protein [Cytobacillus dafuensis]QED46935.1 acyltransferase family protein [Cytobacillus dafuensis]